MDQATDRQRLGQLGEKLACRFLKRQGLRHVTSNYATRGGEIDLVMTEGQTLVFVEVKTRTSEEFAPGEAAVNYGKQRRLWTAARHLLQTHALTNRPLRFDVVVVVPGESRKEPQIRHYRNAFVPRH